MPDRPLASPLLALVRFYAFGSARVAERNALLAVGALIVVVGSAPTPPADMLRELALGLGSRGVPSVAGVGVAAIATTFASAAVPTLLLGLGGWIRSLPLAGAGHRRAITLGLLAPIAPLLVITLLIALLAPSLYRVPLSWPKLAGLPLAALAAAAAATPSRRGIVARPLALAAALLAPLGRWDAFAASIVLLALSDRVAGSIALPPRVASRRAATERGDAAALARRITFRIVARAFGWRAFASLVPGLALVGWAHLYRVNNELTLAEGARSLRACALTGIVLALVALGDLLALRRPAWPWARSLPWGSRRRATDDALAMAACTLPILLLVAREDWRSALVVIATLPFVASVAAGAARRARGRQTRAGGEILVLGGIAAGFVTVWPAVALACLALTPPAIALAARSDRRLVVTAWDELHHVAEGDTLAGSAR